MDRQLAERLASHSAATTSSSLAHSTTIRSSRSTPQRVVCSYARSRGPACWGLATLSIGSTARVCSKQRWPCHALKAGAPATRGKQPKEALTTPQQQAEADSRVEADAVAGNDVKAHRQEQASTAAPQDLGADAEQHSSSDNDSPYVPEQVYEAQLQLTRDIRAAGGWRELRALFKDNRAILNPIHISALLARLSKVQADSTRQLSGDAAAAKTTPASKQARSKEKQEVGALIGAILSASQPLLPDFGAPEISGTLHALARLRVRPGAGWVSAAMEHTRRVLPEAGPWQLGTLMWSLGMLNIDPGPAWLDAFCAASIRCMQRAARNALGSTAASGNFSGGWGSSGNDILGGNAGRYTFIDGERVFLWSSGFRDKDECSVKALVNMAWGLARVKHNVPTAWFEAFCAQIAGRWGELDPFSCSNIAWALATLGVWPGEEWLASLSSTTARLLPQFNTWDLSVTLWALVSWEYNPGSAWLAQFLGRFSAVLPSAQPEHIARILWGLAALGAKPTRQWMMRVYRQTMVQAFDFDAQSFSNTFWAVARLGVPPPKEWVETMMLAVFEQGMEGWGPQEMSNTVWALARIGHIPDPAWLDLLWSESFCQLDRFSPQQLMSMLWAMVKLGQRPPDQWLRQYLKVTQSVMDQLPPEGLANLAWCMASLEVLTVQATHSGGAVRSKPSPKEDIPGAATDGAASSSSSSSSGSRRVRGRNSTTGVPAALAPRWTAALVDASLSSLQSGRWGRGDQAAVAYWRHPQDSEHATASEGAGTSTTSQNSSGGGSSSSGDARSNTRGASSSSSSSSTGTSSSAGSREAAPPRRQVSWGRGPLGQASCKLAWGLAKLRAPVPQDLRDLMLAVTGPQLVSLRVSNLCDLAYSLALLRVKPSQRWIAALIQAVDGSEPVLKHASRLNLGKLVFGARRLGVPPEVCQRWGACDWIGAEIELLETL